MRIACMLKKEKKERVGMTCNIHGHGFEILLLQFRRTTNKITVITCINNAWDVRLQHDFSQADDLQSSEMTSIQLFIRNTSLYARQS